MTKWLLFDILFLLHLWKIFNVRAYFRILQLVLQNFHTIIITHVCHGFQMFLENDYILFLYLNLTDSIPEVKASVWVKRDVSLKISYKKSIVEMRHVSHLLNGKQTIISMTQLCNVLAAVKSWVTDEGSMIHCLNLYKLVLIIINAFYSNVYIIV